ncbi:MAG: VTC domain-containing protein [Benjaminiella poitrasii]|nr:MAG: VTC domain-containing protein [Benjaminiella poitrasii]
MKFEAEFEAKIYEPWRDSYVRYDELNTKLKGIEGSDESFANLFEIELKRVYRFVYIRLQTMTSRASYCDYLLKSYIKQQPVTDAYDAVADSLADILLDIDDLTKFHEINLAAFERIVKEHDSKVAGGRLTSYYFDELLILYPLDKQQFDDLFVKISEMYDICRLYGNPRTINADRYYSKGDQTAFERATSKYWIHPNHITEVKTIILLHLPVHVFNQQKQYETGDSAISSVYFDNERFELYHKRLERSEGAEAIRMRWYGKSTESDDDVYVERKTHHASWMFGKSIKDRFRISECNVNYYVNGAYTAKNLKRDLEKREEIDFKTIEESCTIAEGIQGSIKRKGLKPMCRVFYNRTAFQLPGDQRLRISLDTDLSFIREDHIDGINRRLTKEGILNWRRPDVGIEFPFRDVKDSDILKFPYAILETKIQNHLGQELPGWLNELLESHLVYEVPQFSKYIHGASCLFNNKVSDIPYWLDILREDIRKPVVRNIGLSRSQSFKPLFNGHHRRSLFADDKILQQSLIDGMNARTPSKIAKLLEFGPKVDLPSLGSNEYKHEVTVQESKHQCNTTDSIQHLSIDVPDGSPASSPTDDRCNFTFLQFNRFFKLWKKDDERKEEQNSMPWTPGAFISVLKRGFSYSKEVNEKPFGGRKLDLKAFFSNERTFMAWLHYCILLLTIAIRLVNGEDSTSKIIGSTFIVLTVMVAIYSMGRFHSRAYHLKNGNSISTLEDRYGPIILCVLIATALLVNFYLRIPLIMAED